MKLGLGISCAIVIAFVGVLVAVNRTGEADAPTAATSADRLVRAELPAELPPLHTPRRTAPADAAALYDQAIRHVRRHERALTRSGQQPRDAVRELRRLLVEANKFAAVPEGFLDQFVPMEVAAQPAYGTALETIVQVMLDEADRLADAGDTAAAREVALAVWGLGRHAFERNVRLHPRQRGLAMMQHAGATLARLTRTGEAAIDAEALRRWAAALAEIDEAWRPKLEALLSVDPHVGDLINMVDHDEDRTFRIAATLRLGIARYTAERPANRAAAERAIERLRASDDPLIAEAADAADALTRDAVRRLH